MYNYTTKRRNEISQAEICSTDSNEMWFLNYFNLWIGEQMTIQFLLYEGLIGVYKKKDYLIKIKNKKIGIKKGYRIMGLLQCKMQIILLGKYRKKNLAKKYRKRKKLPFENLRFQK